MIRSRLLSLAVCLATLALIPARSAVPSAVALASRHANHHHAAASKRCAHRNKAVGVVKLSDWQFPDTLNPYTTTEAVSAGVINATQETLVFWDQKPELRPQLLATVPTTKNGGVRDGGKTIVLHLKHGVRWSNGTELTSRDVKFSWRIAMDKASGPLCPAIGCDFITRMDTPDKYTAVLHMKSVYAGIVTSALSFTIMPHVWPGAWASDDVHAAADKLVNDSKFNFEDTTYPSNGAYQVAQFVNNDRIVFTPMKYYATMTCGARLKQLIFAFYSSKPGMIAAAAARQTDVTGFGGGYTIADLPSLKQHVSAYKLNTRSGFNYEFLELNHDPTYNGKPNPIANTNVRLALALALDKLGLIRSSLGVNQKTAQYYEAWTPWVYSPSLTMAYADKSLKGQWDPIAGKFVEPGTPRALADARKLLDRTPFKNGFSVDFYTTAGNPVRQATEAVIAATWSRIGVKVTPFYVSNQRLFASDWASNGVLQHGTFQVSLHGFSTSPEPDGNRTLFQTRFIDRRQQVHSSLNQNTSAVSDAVIDRAFDAAKSTFNSSVRQKNYYAIQTEIDKKAHWIMLYFKPVTITYTPRVGPVFNNPTTCQVTCNVFNWAVKS